MTDDWRTLWVVTWIGRDGVERERECRTRALADELAFDLATKHGGWDIKIDGAAC